MEISIPSPLKGAFLFLRLGVLKYERAPRYLLPWALSQVSDSYLQLWVREEEGMGRITGWQPVSCMGPLDVLGLALSLSYKFKMEKISRF